MTVEEMDNMVQVNINVANHMTMLILPQMRTRKFGTIINVSSASAYLLPTPLFSVYAATKAYNQKFSMTLAEELQNENIEVLATTPYFVTSKMSRMRNGTLSVCTEKTHAEEVLNKLGYNMHTTIPWFNHYIQYVVFSKIPFMAKWGNSIVYNLRTRAMQKAVEKEGRILTTEKKKE